MLSPDSRANLARCQAEAPLIALCRFPKPALSAYDCCDHESMPADHLMKEYQASAGCTASASALRRW